MKKRQIHIQPRRCGKTAKIIEMFIKDWKNPNIDSIIVVPNMMMKSNIAKEISRQLNYSLSAPIISRIFTPDSLKANSFIGVLIDNVYIDEVLFCNKQRLWEAYLNICCSVRSNIIAYSTSDRLYSLELIGLTKILKQNPVMREFIDKTTLQVIDAHYWENIITEDFEIIAPQSKRQPEESFRTEYLGEFYETN